MVEQSISDIWLRLERVIKKYVPLAIAYSGGMDSACLAVAALKITSNVKAFLVASELIPEYEVILAQDIAKRYGIPLQIINISILNLPVFKTNPIDRCYYCKHELFSYILKEVPKGWTLCDGSNWDDRIDVRPGKKALLELGVKSPFEEAEIGKIEIANLLRNWSAEELIRFPQACLATRIPYGTPITAENLATVAKGEEILRRLNFQSARLRHHGKLCRIEVTSADLLRAATVLTTATKEFHRLGFDYVTLDLDGYQRGSMSKAI